MYLCTYLFIYKVVNSYDYVSSTVVHGVKIVAVQVIILYSPQMVTDVSEKPAFIFNVEVVLQTFLLVLFIHQSNGIPFSTCNEFSFSGSFPHLEVWKNAASIAFKHNSPLLFISIWTETCSNIDKRNKLLLSSTPINITILEQRRCLPGTGGRHNFLNPTFSQFLSCLNICQQLAGCHVSCCLRKLKSLH